MEDILTVRQIIQFHCLVAGCPCDGLCIAVRNGSCLCGHAGQVAIATCIGQRHFCAGDLLRAAHCLLAEVDGILGAVLHGDVVAADLVALRCGDCANLAVLNGEVQLGDNLVALRCSHFLHGILAVRQTGNGGLGIAGLKLQGAVGLVQQIAVNSYQIGDPLAVVLGDGDLCARQLLAVGDVHLVDGELCTVDDGEAVLCQSEVIAGDGVALGIGGHEIALIADFESDGNRCKSIHVLGQGVLAGSQSVLQNLGSCAGSPCLGIAVFAGQGHPAACHCIAGNVYLGNGELHLRLVGIGDRFLSRHAGFQNHLFVSAGIGCQIGLAVDDGGRVVANDCALVIQLKDVVDDGLACAVLCGQILEGRAVSNCEVDLLCVDGLAVLIGCLGKASLHAVLVVDCRVESHGDLMIGGGHAVNGGGLGHGDLGRVLGGVGDDAVCRSCIPGQGDLLSAAAVIGNIERLVHGRGGILDIGNNAHGERTACVNALGAVHLKDVVGSCCQLVKGDLSAGGHGLGCANLCITVCILGEQSHSEAGAAGDIACTEHLGNGDAVVDGFGIGDSCLTACLYGCGYGRGVVNAVVRRVGGEIGICQNAVCIGFQHVEVHALGHVGEGQRLAACLGEGQRLYRHCLIADVVLSALGEECEVEGVAGHGIALCCQCLGQGDLAHVLGILYRHGLRLRGTQRDGVICIICGVILNLAALGIGFQQVDVIALIQTGCLLDGSQIDVLHGDRCLGLSCRNGHGNHIAQALAVIGIGEQCEIEGGILCLCGGQFLVDGHINGGVRCLYPNADLCRLCHHDSVAQNLPVLISVGKAVPCDVLLAGLCHVAGNGCGKGHNDLIVRFYHCAGQTEAEVHCAVFVLCPAHGVVLSQPVLGVLVQRCSLVGGVSDIVGNGTSVDGDRLDIAHGHAKGRVSVIAGNQTQVAHIGQTVDDGHVLHVYRRVVLDVQGVLHLLALHALYIVVCGVAALAGIGLGVSMGCAVVPLIGIGDGLPRFGGQTNDVIVGIVPDLGALFLTGNHAVCGIGLVCGGVARVGDNALLFLTSLDNGCKLHHNGVVGFQLAAADACTGRTGQIPYHGAAGCGGIDRRTGAGHQSGGCVSCKLAVCIQLDDKVLCGEAAAVVLVAAGQVIRQRHAGKTQLAQLIAVQRCLAVCGLALTIIKDSLPDQGVAGGDIAVFHLLYVGTGVICAGIGGCCQFCKARRRCDLLQSHSRFGVGCLILDHAAVVRCHHTGYRIGECGALVCGLGQFFCLCRSEYGLVCDLDGAASAVQGGVRGEGDGQFIAIQLRSLCVQSSASDGNCLGQVGVRQRHAVRQNVRQGEHIAIVVGGILRIRTEGNGVGELLGFQLFLRQIGDLQGCRRNALCGIEAEIIGNLDGCGRIRTSGCAPHTALLVPCAQRIERHIVAVVIRASASHAHTVHFRRVLELNVLSRLQRQLVCRNQIAPSCIRAGVISPVVLAQVIRTGIRTSAVNDLTRSLAICGGLAVPAVRKLNALDSRTGQVGEACTECRFLSGGEALETGLHIVRCIHQRFAGLCVNDPLLCLIVAGGVPIGFHLGGLSGLAVVTAGGGISNGIRCAGLDSTSDGHGDDLALCQIPCAVIGHLIACYRNAYGLACAADSGGSDVFQRIRHVVQECCAGNGKLAVIDDLNGIGQGVPCLISALICRLLHGDMCRRSFRLDRHGVCLFAVHRCCVGKAAGGGVGECAGDGDGHGLACRNVHCRRHCCHGLSVYGIGDIGQRKSADVIGDRNTCGIPDAGVVDGDGVSHGLSGNAGVVLLSQIAALIADQTVLGGGDDCLVLFHGDGILGVGLAVRHLVGQCGVVVRIHGADNLCCHGLAAGNIPESHRVAGNRAAVLRGDAGDGHACRNYIGQRHVPCGIAGIGGGDGKGHAVALDVIRLLVVSALAQPERCRLRCGDIQRNVVAADGLEVIGAVGLSAHCQRILYCTVVLAQCHGAAVQRECHVQTNGTHFRIGVLAANLERDVRSCAACCRTDFECALFNGIPCIGSGCLDGVFNAALRTACKSKTCQTDGVLKPQRFHPLHAGFLGGVVGCRTQGVVHRCAGSDFAAVQLGLILRLRGVPHHLCLGGNGVADALSVVRTHQLDLGLLSIGRFACLILCLKPYHFGIAVLDGEFDIAVYDVTARILFHVQGVAVVHRAVCEAVSGKVRQKQIRIRNVDLISIHFAGLIDVVSGDSRHQIEHGAGLSFVNRLEFVVPELNACIGQNQRVLIGAGAVCRCKDDGWQARNQYHRCQENADQSYTK